MAETDIVISGYGMRTAVGNGSVQTCASVRAGINRFAEWPWFAPCESPDDEEPSGIVGSAVTPDLGDEDWTVKAQMLLVEPIFEALWQARLFESTAIQSIVLYLATPYIDRCVSQLTTDEASLDEEMPATQTERVEEDEPLGNGSESERHYRSFMRKTEAALRESVQLAGIRFFPNDHAGGGAALAAAMNDIASGKVSAAIVGGVDSLMCSAHLEHLMASGCLKSQMNPLGLIPGEGAAMIVLESRKSVAKRGVLALAAIASVELAMESYHIGDDSAITAQSLSKVLRSAVEKAGGAKLFHELIVDLNGQRARFLEWATTETRCMHAFPRGWKLSHPADCLGDVGAAFVPIALGLATRSFERGYGQSPVLVCSSSVRGERVAITILPIHP